MPTTSAHTTTLPKRTKLLMLAPGVRLLCRRYASVVGVAHFFEPGGLTATDLIELGLGIRRRAVPVRRTRRRPDRFALPQIASGLSADLYAAAAFFGQDQLSTLMCVPLRPRARPQDVIGQPALGLQHRHLAAGEVGSLVSRGGLVSRRCRLLSAGRPCNRGRQQNTQVRRHASSISQQVSSHRPGLLFERGSRSTFTIPESSTGSPRSCNNWRSSAAVSRCTFRNSAYSTPSAMINGVHPILFLTSSLAPTSARY